MSSVRNPENPYQLPPAQLDWDSSGAPVSMEFGDIYFSREGGLAETDYVFLQQNCLAERWRALDANNPGVFVIGETGFGTGLNFLAAWLLWNNTAPASWRLHFISVEQYPLTRAQLQRALSAWPELEPLAALLVQHYPPRLPGFHTHQLAPNVTLQCIFDDAGAGLNTLLDSAANLPNGFYVDAWFLDGFAPAKNPAMWSEQLFHSIARLSRTGSSFATFTAAGLVKRGLSAAGFGVEKISGYGSKREMLRGIKNIEAATVSKNIEQAISQEVGAKNVITKPVVEKNFPTKKTAAIEYWAYPPTALTRQTVTIIGGGLAGTSTAHALAQRGWPVRLLESGAALAAGASGNPQGILYTKLSPEAGTLAQFALSSYIHALDHYRYLQAQRVLPADAVHWCGVLQLETDARLRETFADQPEWVQALSAADASAIAGCGIPEPALWFPRAGWLRPVAICAALAQHALIDVRLNCTVRSLEQHGNGWRINTSQGELEAGIVIVAAANDSLALAPTAALPLRPIRGQITELPAAFLRAQPRTVICHDGYLAPSPHAADGICLGATFDQNDFEMAARANDHRRNLQTLHAASPSLLRAEAFDQNDNLQGRVGQRCTTPDYLPLVGAVADTPQMRARFAVLARNARTQVDAIGAWLPGLYVNVGHGSRGLTSTPICAELLAALITGAPRPLPRALVHALSPARFALRDLIRGR